MHRLHLLGRAFLERESGYAEGAASRPRPLALLALLAVAGKVGIGRDKCLVYLWPESDTQRARNSLHQTLHAIRTDLGPEVIDSGPPLTLSPEQLTVDLWEFEAALTAGDIDQAIALYQGPFLDGFALDDLPELEEWIFAERVRLTRGYAAALERSAKQSSERGDHTHAVQQWRARAQLEPLSAPPTLGFMKALVASGDRALALATGNAYAELVRRELSSDPDPTIRDLIAALRRPTAASPRPAIVLQAAPMAEPVLPVEPPSTPLPAATPLPVSAPAPETAVHRGFRAVHAAALLLIGALAAVLAFNLNGRPAANHSPEVIAVFPFTVAGAEESGFLRNGLVDLLSASLDGAGSIRGADPHALLGWLESRQITTPTPVEAGAIARQLGAGRFVLGSVTSSGSRLRLVASLYQYDRPDSAFAAAVTEGDASDLFRLVDDLTSQLLVATLPGPRHRLMRVAATTTSSLPALKSYLAGEEELRSGRYVEAADAFQAAVRQDSGFALAYYRLAFAADWLGRDSVARSAGEAAVKRAARLSDHDSLLVNAALAARRGDVEGSERLYRQIVDDYPDDLEAWLQLGAVLFHRNPLRGRSATESREAYERALALDPDDSESLLYLARISSLEGNRRAVDSLAERLLRITPDSEVLELRAFRAFALSDRDSWKRVTRELLVRPPDVPPVTALEVALFLDDLDGAERFGVILTEPRYSADMRAQGHRLLARAAAARGQWPAARAQLDSAAVLGPVSALELRSLLASLDFLDVPVDEVVAMRDVVQRWNAATADADPNPHSAGHAGLHFAIRAYRIGLLSARLGDRRTLVAQIDSLDRARSRAGGRSEIVLATLTHSLRARAAFAAGDAAGALRHLDQTNWLPIESSFEEEANDRYLRGVVLRALGRDAEAATWFRTIAQRATHELIYVAPSRLHESAIAAGLGDSTSAAAAYRVTARLWSNAEASIRHKVGEAGAQLRRSGIAIPED